MDLKFLNRASGIGNTLGARGILAMWAILIGLTVAAQPGSGVYINEVMVSNGTTIADEDGDYEDWIELYNSSDEVVNLSGWGLSDNYRNPFKWTFPEGTVIGAGDFLMVWASGKDRKDQNDRNDLYDPDWVNDFSDAAGLWLFEGEDDNVAWDSSTNGNHGAVSGAVRLNLGQVNVMRFQASNNQQITIPNDASLQITGSMTVSMWLQPHALGRRQNPWGKAYGGEGTITLEPEGHLNFYWGTSGDNSHPYQRFHSVEPIAAREWTHIVVVRDFENNQLRWYLNGSRTATESPSYPWATSSDNNLRIGNEYAGAFDGKIGMVLLLPHALDDAQVDDLHLKTRGAYRQPLHTNFSISSEGEEIILTLPGGTRVDELPPTALPRDISIGRAEGEGDTWFYFDEPTPGSANTTTAYTGILDPPTFSHAGGFYTSEFDLQLTAPVEGTTIIYTLDGSEPCIDNLDGTTYLYKNSYPQDPGDPFGDFLEQSYTSLEYSSPINVYDRSAEPDKLTQMSSTWDRTPDYFPSTPVRKGTVVRARTFKEGVIPSRTTTETFFVWPEGNPYSLPVISLTIQENNLFEYNEGNYIAGVAFDKWHSAGRPGTVWSSGAHFLQKGREWERPCNFEYFENGSNHSVINQGAGYRIHGGTSPVFQLKNMRLYARSDHDEQNVFQYGFFEEQVPFASIPNNSTFKRLLIRRQGAGWNPGWVLYDIVFNRLMQPVFEGVIRHQPVLKFINGEFWGLTAVRDRIDRYHFGYHYNIDPDNIIVTSGNFVDEGVASDQELFNYMYNFIRNNQMSNNNNFLQAQEMLDIQSYCDHLIINHYSGNSHYEHGYWRARVPSDNHFGDGKWRAIINDFDAVLLTENSLYGWFWPLGENPEHRPMPPLFLSLINNTQFKNYFINRFADHINTTFIPSRFQKIIDDSWDEVAAYFSEDSLRAPSRLLFAESGKIDLLNWSNEHPARQRKHIREYFELGEEINLIVDVSHHTHGHVRVNTVEIIPTTPGVSDTPYPWTGIYFEDIPIEIEAIAAPGYMFVGWEDLPEATGTIVQFAPLHNRNIKALFAPLPEPDLQPIHYWHFNDRLTEDEGVPSDFSAVGEAWITYPGTGTGYMDYRTHRTADPVSNHNLLLGQQPNQGAVLRVRNPSNTRELLFKTPTTGFGQVELIYATTRTGNGATVQQLYFSPDGGTTWTTIGDPYIVPELDPTDSQRGYLHVYHDLTAIPEVQNNDDLQFKIVFSGNEAANEDGNNRFDNFSVIGQIIPPTAIITASAGTGGSITPEGAVIVNHGTIQTFTIIHASGYKIADVLVDGQSVGAVASYTFEDVTDNHTIEAIFDLLTNITETDSPGVRVFPNPSNEWITVESSKMISEIHLVDLFGNTLKTKAVNDVSFKIDVSTLSPGVYFVQILTNEGTRAVRVSVVR